MTSKEFIKKLNDPEIVKKMEAAKTPEEAYAVAKSYGLKDSIENFSAEMIKLKAAVGELNDNDLEAVAGGRVSTSEAAEITVAAATAGAAF